VFSQLIKSTCCKRSVLTLSLSMLCTTASVSTVSGEDTSQYEVVGEFSLSAGDTSLEKWKMPPVPDAGIDQETADALVALGRKLFFDKSLSANESRSCASCHRPELGWSDGLPTAAGLEGQSLGRATLSLVNVAYGTIFMWDGRAATLEEQATQPIFNAEEMGLEPEQLLAKLEGDPDYRGQFADLFPEQGISVASVSSALAAFERTIVISNTRFDQWIAGNAAAMTPAEIRGFGVFLDPDRGSCGTCHAAPNFTDEGFHNIGLESPGDENPDLGRYNIRPIKLMRGAFKTPSLRNIALTAPYFHDGSADTLMDVVEHYIDSGAKDNLSPEMREIELSEREKNDLIAFLHAISESPRYSQHSAISVAPE